jgi:hypothetical protein
MSHAFQHAPSILAILAACWKEREAHRRTTDLLWASLSFL